LPPGTEYGCGDPVTVKPKDLDRAGKLAGFHGRFDDYQTGLSIPWTRRAKKKREEESWDRYRETQLVWPKFKQLPGPASTKVTSKAAIRRKSGNALARRQCLWQPPKNFKGAGPAGAPVFPRGSKFGFLYHLPIMSLVFRFQNVQVFYPKKEQSVSVQWLF